MATINVSKIAPFRIINLASEMTRRLPRNMKKLMSSMWNAIVPKRRAATLPDLQLLDYPMTIAKYITLVKTCPFAFLFPFLFAGRPGMDPRNKLCVGLRVRLWNHQLQRLYHNGPNLPNALHNTQSNVRYLYK
jgi:hypothetical protein